MLLERRFARLNKKLWITLNFVLQSSVLNYHVISHLYNQVCLWYWKHIFDLAVKPWVFRYVKLMLLHVETWFARFSMEMMGNTLNFLLHRSVFIHHIFPHLYYQFCCGYWKHFFDLLCETFSFSVCEINVAICRNMICKIQHGNDG